MRKRFEQEITLDSIAITDVKFDLKSRDQMPPLLMGLQYVFKTPEVNEQIFRLLEKKITGDKKATGRYGMTLWEILVFGVVRLNLNLDYSRLHDLANNHINFRGILGVGSKNFFYPSYEYCESTIKENGRLIDDETLAEINVIIVKSGHEMLKKKEDEGILKIKLKSDSFPLASNIHFPTDMNLLWDSLHKSLSLMDNLQSQIKIGGWRKKQYIKKTIKGSYRKTSEIHRKKGGNYQERLENSVHDYLKMSKVVSSKIKKSLVEVAAKSTENLDKKLKELGYYISMIDKHVDLLERRIVKGEKIPHSEKIFSIFEDHAEWLSKGKLNEPVVIGHNILITTDQYQFIVDYEVYEKITDTTAAIPLGKRIASNYNNGYSLECISFDRGFYSLLAKQALGKIFDMVIMPKPGKKSVAIELEESDTTYKKIRKAHSTVESNINELQQSGLKKVTDKGIEGFKRYVSYAVLAHNLKRLGKMLLQDERDQIKVRKKSA